MNGPHLFIKNNNSFYWIKKENPALTFTRDEDRVFKRSKDCCLYFRAVSFLTWLSLWDAIWYLYFWTVTSPRRKIDSWRVWTPNKVGLDDNLQRKGPVHKSARLYTCLHRWAGGQWSHLACGRILDGFYRLCSYGRRSLFCSSMSCTDVLLLRTAEWKWEKRGLEENPGWCHHSINQGH